jgi:hypothetical protein
MEFTKEAYTSKEIAKVIHRSDNYVKNRLKAADVLPEGERVTAMGPNPKVWSGTTLSGLAKQGKLETQVGEIIWFDQEPAFRLDRETTKRMDKVFKEINKTPPRKDISHLATQVYLIKAYLMDDNQPKPIYKIGITNKKDIIKTRFKEEIKTGLLEDVNVLANFWCDTRTEAEQLEKHLFELVVDQFGGYKMTDGSGQERFHNFWTKDMPKGITEMRKLDVKETTFLVEYFNNLTSE